MKKTGVSKMIVRAIAVSMLLALLPGMTALASTSGYSEYSAEDDPSPIDSIAAAGDVLKYFESPNNTEEYQEDMLIKYYYSDGSGNKLKENKTANTDYTIPDFSEEYTGIRKPVGMQLEGWKIIQIPTAGDRSWGLLAQWEADELQPEDPETLTTVVGPLAYLFAGRTYQLGSSAKTLHGDPTVYESGIIFRVASDGLFLIN